MQVECVSAANCLLPWPWTPLAPIGKSLAPKRRQRALGMHTLVLSALVQMLLQMKCTLLIDVRLPTQTHTDNHSPNSFLQHWFSAQCFRDVGTGHTIATTHLSDHTCF